LLNAATDIGERHVGAPAWWWWSTHGGRSDGPFSVVALIDVQPSVSLLRRRNRGAPCTLRKVAVTSPFANHDVPSAGRVDVPLLLPVGDLPEQKCVLPGRAGDEGVVGIGEIGAVADDPVRKGRSVPLRSSVWRNDAGEDGWTSDPRERRLAASAPVVEL
jgi:hypothetical protein